LGEEKHSTMPAHRTCISLYVAAEKFNDLNHRLTAFNYGDKKKNEQMLLEQKKEKTSMVHCNIQLIFLLIHFLSNKHLPLNERKYIAERI
jgi:hypothetical protein